MKKILETLNKIDSVSEKIKYLEVLLDKEKNKKKRKELFDLIKKVEKTNKKRLSFEEIHKKESKDFEELKVTAESKTGEINDDNISSTISSLEQALDFLAESAKKEGSYARKLESPMQNSEAGAFDEASTYIHRSSLEYLPLEANAVYVGNPNLTSYIKSQDPDAAHFSDPNVEEKNLESYARERSIMEKEDVKKVSAERVGEYKRK